LWGPFESAVVPGAWTIEAGQASTGGTVRWLMDLAGARWDSQRRYEAADAEAALLALWLQILADVAGIPIEYTTSVDEIAFGTAMCAAVGAGVFADLGAATAAMANTERSVEPDPTAAAAYAQGYDRYVRTTRLSHRCSPQASPARDGPWERFT